MSRTAKAKRKGLRRDLLFLHSGVKCCRCWHWANVVHDQQVSAGGRTPHLMRCGVEISDLPLIGCRHETSVTHERWCPDVFDAVLVIDESKGFLVLEHVAFLSCHSVVTKECVKSA